MTAALNFALDHTPALIAGCFLWAALAVIAAVVIGRAADIGDEKEGVGSDV